MKEKLFALFWVLFFALPLYAQADKTGSYSIKGQVLDSLSNESVPYATLRIALAKTPDKPVKLLACDVDGKFQAPLSSAGKYIISMQSIGKAPAEKTFTISDKQRNLDLGKLYMQEDNQRLGEVTVTAQKPLVKAEIDKLTYSLEDDPEAQTNNTLEMLRKVPMVTVDGDDQIQLKGSTNFKIYMNGKPSNLLSNNPAEVLKSMPANSVKNIEVITDPGAKYDAEGIGGIINIITTKNALQGYTGTVRVNGSSLGRVGGGGYISLKAGKFGLTANYNYNYNREPWNESTSIREDLAEMVISSKNLMNNYTASVLQAPAFTPTPHSEIVFNEAFRANQYVAFGLSPILKLSKLLHFRLDMYGFAPLYEIQKTVPENNPYVGIPHYGKFLHSFNYMGEAAVVLQLPFLCISLYANGYSYPKENFNFGLNIGYLIFNPKMLD